MSDTSSAEFRAALEKELIHATANARLDSSGQLSWLIDQLDEYLDRWIAFAAVETISMQALARSNLFTAIAVGAGAVDERLRSSAMTDSEPQWIEFMTALRRINADARRGCVSELRAAYDAFLAHVRRRQE